MATTKIWAVKDNLKRVIDYATNPEKTNSESFDFSSLEEVIAYTSNDDKTEKQLYVSGINCSPSTAVIEMIQSKQSADKIGSVLAFHAMQSFKGKEVDPSTAHKIGIQLANEMWGKEFEVIVTTHLNTNNVHNHFVVNSVSFVTKKRFINRHSDYRRFKELSDKICKEYELSVIDTYKSGKSYAEINAERNDKITKRSIIRKDVDYAVSISRTRTQFVKELEKMGYELKFGKHWALRPKGTNKYFRFYKLSNNGSYDEMNLMLKILDNKYSFETIQKQENKPLYLKGDIKKTRKLTGFKALCFKYMYMMGVISNHAPSNKKVHFLFKEELIKMDQFTKEVTLVFKKHINSFEDLDNYQKDVEKQRNDLIKERSNLYSKIRRCKNNDYKILFEKDKNALNEQISLLNEEIKNCNGLRESMKVKTVKIQLMNEIDSKDKNQEKQKEDKSK